MLQKVDLAFGYLLVVGGLLHAYGTYAGYPPMSAIQIWSWSGTLAALLLAAVNILRVNRPADRALAWICVVGGLAWASVAAAFGATLPNPLDPRVLYHVIVALVLAGFSLRTLMR